VHSYLVDAEYDVSSPYGAFRLREERTPTGMLESDFVQSVSHFCNDGGDGAGSGCTSTLIDIGSGQHGALLYGPNGDTSVTAVETFDGQDYKLIVMGPGGFIHSQTRGNSDPRGHRPVPAMN
jgi:hypothetical protein